MTPRTPLSEREQQVLGLFLNGKSNCEIAQVLNISEKTVRSQHMRSIYRKFGFGAMDCKSSIKKGREFLVEYLNSKHSTKVVMGD